MKQALFAVMLVSVSLNGPGGVDTTRTDAKQLSAPDVEAAFTFAILGDRTSGNDLGLPILRQAVRDINILGPDFVMSVGDLIQGYCGRAEWMRQMRDFQRITGNFTMPFYPVPGNHDIYWRGPGRPAGEHEADYEKHFGPLWYAFEYRNCWFIVLYTDEGDPKLGRKNFKNAAHHKMSQAQLDWLESVLKKAKGAQHLFVFQHHPRWRWGRAHGTSWKPTEKLFLDAGIPTTVFGGHIHKMTYGGVKKNMEYFTLSVTGAKGGRYPDAGILDHFNLVTVRGRKVSVGVVPVGVIRDPRDPNLREGWKVNTIVLKNTPFDIASEETRKLSWDIRIPESEAEMVFLKIGVGHPCDDAGDKGLVCRLIKAGGKPVVEKFMMSTKTQMMTRMVRPGTEWKVVIEDRDTVFGGNSSGNKGTIQVTVHFD